MHSGAISPLLLLLVASPFARAQTIERVSVSTSGLQGNASPDVAVGASADGRFVVFRSQASNFFAGDVPLTRDTFLRDRVSGTTTRIAGDVFPVALSPDGTLLSYTEFVDVGLGSPIPFAHVLNLVTNLDQALTTTGTSSAGPFSGDGRYLLYVRDTVQAFTPRIVVRRELATGIEDVANLNTSGAQSFAPVFTWPGTIAYDGSIVTFTSDASDLVSGDTNMRRDAFYHDFNGGFTSRYGLTELGVQIPSPFGSMAGSFSADTRFFLFSSDADGIVSGDANANQDLFVYDRFVPGTTIVSIGNSQQFGNDASSSLPTWISPDGERCVFESRASNLVLGDTNNTTDVFLRDVAAGTTRRLVLGIGGAQPNLGARLAGVSPDGRFLVIVSASSNLVTGDTNGLGDVFLVDLGPQCAVVPYCTALPNSTGLPAAINATGTPSFSLNNFVLSCVDLPPLASCMFFQGTTRIDPAVPFGNGLLCAGGALTRVGSATATGGVVIQFQDLLSPAYAGMQAGDVRRFQIFYRDPLGGGALFNTSSAIEVSFCP